MSQQTNLLIPDDDLVLQNLDAEEKLKVLRALEYMKLNCQDELISLTT